MIVNIEKMSYGPDSIAHLENGKVVFVPYGVPGDTVDIEVVSEKAKMAQSRIVSVVEPSASRIEAHAPELLTSLCPWEQMSHEMSIEQKRQIVCDALIRVGHMDEMRVQELVRDVVVSDSDWGYRNKIELGAEIGAQGKLELGVFEHDSNTLVPLSSCALGNNLIEDAPKKLCGALRYALGDRASMLFRVGIRGSVITNGLEVALWTEPGKIQRDFIAKAVKDATNATSVVRLISSAGSARRVKKLEVLSGSGFWKERIAGCTFKVSAPSFFQVNTSQAEKMVELVLSALGDVEGKMIADLYCGVGTFSIPLAKRGADLLCIELAGSSVSDLRDNLGRAGLEADVICDDVERVLSELEDLDAIVVDPPRAGLAASVIDKIADSGASQLIYISCDPQTLARDISRLEKRGAKLLSCTPVDMFPQTYHIECVCELGF